MPLCPENHTRVHERLCLTYTVTPNLYNPRENPVKPFQAAAAPRSAIVPTYPKQCQKCNNHNNHTTTQRLTSSPPCFSKYTLSTLSTPLTHLSPTQTPLPTLSPLPSPSHGPAPTIPNPPSPPSSAFHDTHKSPSPHSHASDASDKADYLANDPGDRTRTARPYLSVPAPRRECGTRYSHPLPPRSPTSRTEWSAHLKKHTGSAKVSTTSPGRVSSALA